MHAALSILSGALLLSACMPFVPPTRSEPHALAKVRVHYHVRPSAGLQHALYLNGRPTALALPNGSITTPYSQALRVPAGALAWRFVSAFQHTEPRPKDLSVLHASLPACVRPSGGALHASPLARPCGLLDLPAPTAQPTHISVTDASCDASTRLTARAGALYLLQYDFHGDGQCSLRCFEQVAGEGGELVAQPCAE